MKAILSFPFHPRTREPRRLPAPIAWVTALAVLVAQGAGPSYAGIAVSTYGSSATVHLDVLDWSGGVPARVAAYLPDRAQPVVRTVDREAVRAATWTPTRSDGAWQEGRVTVPAATGTTAYDVAYRSSGTGLEAFAVPAADPGGGLHIRLDGGEYAEGPQYIGTVLVIALICGLLNDIEQQRCLDKAQDTCGRGNVKCASFVGVCGVGRCTVQCQGSDEGCE